MAMVPILAVMSGALAYSAFSGTVTTTLDASSASVSFTQTVYFNGTNAMNTPLILSSSANSAGTSVLSTTPNETVGSVVGQTGQDVSFTVSAAHFVPSTWVKFVVGIQNTGSAALDLNTSGNSFTLGSTPAAYVWNGTGFHLTPAAIPYSVIAPPMTQSAFVNLLSVQPYSGNWTFAFGSVGRATVPQYLEPGQTFYFSVYVGLGDLEGNSAQDTSLSLSFVMPMTAAP